MIAVVVLGAGMIIVVSLPGALYITWYPVTKVQGDMDCYEKCDSTIFMKSSKILPSMLLIN